MTQDNQVVIKSTTMHGYLYHVYAKDNPYKRLYIGQISDDPKYNYCECQGWVTLEKCYHNEFAHKITEIKIA